MKKDEQQKAFVLDTNVILHDPKCIFKFQEHDVVISTTVLEEIDTFKKGTFEINRNARDFVRSLDELLETNDQDEEKLHNGGLLLGSDKGKIQVKIFTHMPDSVKTAFPLDKNDNRILGLVENMTKEEGEKRKVVLVTKDRSLRIKASCLNLKAEDYENDKSKFEGFLGREKVSYPDAKIKKLYEEHQQQVDQSLIESHPDGILENTYFILEGKKQSALARYSSNQLIKIEKTPVFKINPRNSEQTFSIDILQNENVKLVCLSGKAGTGKTLLAMAVGLDALKKKKVAQLIVAAAIMPMDNRDNGFLPGDDKEKVIPYMQGIFDNLAFIKRQASAEDQKWIEECLKSGSITIQPLAYIRGRSLNDAFFIIDETQNITPHAAKTIITRAGQNTKVVLCGDVTQIDSPYLDPYSNGLANVIVKMTGQPIFAHVNLQKGERSELAEIAADIL